VIDADRYPLSPRVRRLKELLAKIDSGDRAGHDVYCIHHKDPRHLI
jgi:hypothetical protein